jgi:hypothetical protein
MEERKKNNSPEKETSVIPRESTQDTLDGIKETQDKKSQPKSGAVLHTYSGDIAETMEDKKGSVLKIALAEQERQKNFKEVADPKSSRNILYIFGSIALVIASFILFVTLILSRTQTVVIQSQETVLPSLVFAENQSLVDITGFSQPKIIRSIEDARANVLNNDNSIINIFIANKNNKGQLVKETAGNFFVRTTSFAPTELISTLRDNFTFGVYTKSGVDRSFLLFEYKKFDETFLGMSLWEDNIVDDTLKLFNYDKKLITSDIFITDFKNEFLFNKESRVLRDVFGNLIVAYVYVEEGTVLLTHDLDTIEEVLRRLQTQSLK